MQKLPVCHTHTYMRQTQRHWSPQSAVTGLSLVGEQCPVPPDPLSVSPSGRGPGSVATQPWGSSAHHLTQAGPLSSWHRTVGMAPPLGRCGRENDTKTDRERQCYVSNIKFTDRYCFKQREAHSGVGLVKMSSWDLLVSLELPVMWSRVNWEDPGLYGLHRKCIMSGGLWAEFVFGHLCSASAGVGCCGLNPWHQK